MSTEAKRFSETGKDKESKFRFAVSTGIEQALSLTRDKFETKGSQDRQFYHINPHIQGEIYRTTKILKVIHSVRPDLVSERDILLGALVGAHHDEDQEWQVKYEPDENDPKKRKKCLRQRALGKNEAQSGNGLEGYMLATNKVMRDEIFTPRDIKVGKEGIDLTVPTFEKGTVIHPKFADYSHNIIAQAVALADIGGGMEPFTTTRWESDAILLEDNVDIARYLFPDGTNSAIEPVDEEWYLDRIIKQGDTQLNFYQGRQREVAKNIASMDIGEKAKEAVAELFKYFPDTFREIQELTERRKKMKTLAEARDDLAFSLKRPPIYDLSELFAA